MKHYFLFYHFFKYIICVSLLYMLSPLYIRFYSFSLPARRHRHAEPTQKWIQKWCGSTFDSKIVRAITQDHEWKYVDPFSQYGSVVEQLTGGGVRGGTTRYSRYSFDRNVSLQWLLSFIIGFIGDTALDRGGPGGNAPSIGMFHRRQLSTVIYLAYSLIFAIYFSSFPLHVSVQNTWNIIFYFIIF